MARTYLLQCKLESTACYRTYAIYAAKDILITSHRSWKTINDEAQHLKSRNKLVRLVKSSEDAEKVTGFIQRLSWSIQSFMVRVTWL